MVFLFFPEPFLQTGCSENCAKKEKGLLSNNSALGSMEPTTLICSKTPRRSQFRWQAPMNGSGSWISRQKQGRGRSTSMATSALMLCGLVKSSSLQKQNWKIASTSLSITEGDRSLWTQCSSQKALPETSEVILSSYWTLLKHKRSLSPHFL